MPGSKGTRYRYRVVDVFTEQPLEGNPLAVFPDASGLDDQTMQKIAKEAGIPVVGATETEPAGENYQSWMMSELDAVQRAPKSIVLSLWSAPTKWRGGPWLRFQAASVSVCCWRRC